VQTPFHTKKRGARGKLKSGERAARNGTKGSGAILPSNMKTNGGEFGTSSNNGVGKKTTGKCNKQTLSSRQGRRIARGFESGFGRGKKGTGVGARIKNQTTGKEMEFLKKQRKNRAGGRRDA